MEQLIDHKTVAKLLGVQPGTIYVWVSRRTIPFMKVRGALRFQPSALESWLKERVYQPEAALMRKKGEKTMINSKWIYVGDEVEYQPIDPPLNESPWSRTARVIEIGRDDHQINNYNKVLYEEKSQYEFTLDDGRWCYGLQIRSVSEWFCQHCDERFINEDERDNCACSANERDRAEQYSIELADARTKGEL